MKEENYRCAVECYTRAIDLDLRNAVYYCNRYFTATDPAEWPLTLCGPDAENHALPPRLTWGSEFATFPFRAAAHSKLGNYTEATGDCERAIGIDPTYSKAYGRMG